MDVDDAPGARSVVVDLLFDSAIEHIIDVDNVLGDGALVVFVLNARQAVAVIPGVLDALVVGLGTGDSLLPGSVAFIVVAIVPGAIGRQPVVVAGCVARHCAISIDVETVRFVGLEIVVGGRELIRGVVRKRARAVVVLCVVRNVLSDQLRGKFDSDDFRQEVLMDVFANPHQLCQCRSRAEVFAYSAAVARNKVRDESRKQLGTARHDLRRDVPLEELTSRAGEEPEALASREPGPEAEAIAREALANLLDNQPAEIQQALFLKYLGESCEQIARLLGRPVRTVRRWIRKRDPRNKPLPPD
jgi:RNA polymerase sigma factor (sigma-70 family)